MPGHRGERGLSLVLGYSLLDNIPHFPTVNYAFCERFPPELSSEIFERYIWKPLCFLEWKQQVFELMSCRYSETIFLLYCHGLSKPGKDSRNLCARRIRNPARQ